MEDETQNHFDNILSILEKQRSVNILLQKQIDELNERFDTLINGPIKS